MNQSAFTLARDPRSLPRALRDAMFETDLKLRRAHETLLGHPYNLSFTPGEPAGFADYLIRNGAEAPTEAVGGAPFGAEVSAQEREALDWLMRLWGCHDLDAHVGAILSCGSEANLRALHLGREALAGAVVFHGAAAHGSIPEAARMLGLPATEIPSVPSGAIDLIQLAEAARRRKGRPVILALTTGTPMTGANDDIAGAIAALDAAGIDEDHRFIHVDGALGGMILPFLPDAPRCLIPGFELMIDSLSTSGHKMIGTPIPCGVLVCRREIANPPGGGGLSGLTWARSGHAALAIWARLLGRGYAAFASDARHGVRRAKDLAAGLREALGEVSDIHGPASEVLCNPWSLTVTFPEPDAEMVRRYQLACRGGRARAVVMPSVPGALLDRFVEEYRTFAGSRAGRK